MSTARRSSRFSRGLLIGLLASAPLAADSTGTLHHSFDVTVQRDGAEGPVFDDDTAIAETTAPAWSAVSLGSLPAGADVTALHHADDGRWYFALDTFVTFDEAVDVHAGPEDVVAWNGATHALAFDGSAAGVPPGTAVDAVAQAPGFGLLLSFDTAFEVDTEVADDEDLVAWDGVALTLVFDGSDFAVPAALDLDAVDFDGATEELYLSFDGSGTLGGVDFDDHDLLRFDLATWTKISYPGLAQAGTAAADLDAVDYVTVGVFADDFESGDAERWSSST